MHQDFDKHIRDAMAAIAATSTETSAVHLRGAVLSLVLAVEALAEHASMPREVPER